MPFLCPVQKGFEKGRNGISYPMRDTEQNPALHLANTHQFAFTVFTLDRTHVKAGGGSAALPKLLHFGFSWRVMEKRAPHRSPEACLQQVWSSSLHTPPLLPLILFPLTLIHCNLDADKGRTTPPFLTPRQLTHFQRG